MITAVGFEKYMLWTAKKKDRHFACLRYMGS